MRIGAARGDAAARGAHQESLLDQKGLDHILDGAALLAHGRRQAVDAHRAALEFLDHRQQQFSVQHVEPLRVDFQHVERRQAPPRR